MLIITLFLAACSEEPAVETSVDAKPVAIRTVELKEHESYLTYNGIIQSSNLKKLSFKYGGTIQEIMVETGDAVTQDQALIGLDKEDLSLKLNDDLKNKQIVLNNIDKAKTSYNYLLDQLNKNEQLYAAGAIAKQQYEDLQMEVDLAQNNLSIAQNNLARTEISIQNTRKMINEYVLTSPSAGVIADVLGEEGENIAAGQPIIILKNDILEVQFGINQNDYNKVEKNDEILIEFEGESYTGIINKIDQFPDEKTMTYQVKADLYENDIPINSIVKIKIPDQKVYGAKIPINSIISRTDDYVYVVEEGHVTLKKINVILISGYEVICTGLDNRDQVIIEGMKSLNDGDRVNINSN